jgi:type II secretory pathway pseudopilin PulG
VTRTEPRMKAVLSIIGFVAALAAWTWLDNVVAERGELREQVAAYESESLAAARQVRRLTDRLAAVTARLPRVKDRAYQRGRADGNDSACNTVFGNGPALDAWTHLAYDEYGHVRADVRAVVIVTIEDGSTQRIDRATCWRFA